MSSSQNRRTKFSFFLFWNSNFVIDCHICLSCSVLEKYHSLSVCKKQIVTSLLITKSLSVYDHLICNEYLVETKISHFSLQWTVNGLISASGEVMEFDIPQEEKVFQPMTISEEEKRVHADFFDGRPPKTPERYLKIRSYIIDCWYECYISLWICGDIYMKYIYCLIVNVQLHWSQQLSCVTLVPQINLINQYVFFILCVTLLPVVVSLYNTWICVMQFYKTDRWKNKGKISSRR